MICDDTLGPCRGQLHQAAWGRHWIGLSVIRS